METVRPKFRAGAATSRGWVYVLEHPERPGVSKIGVGPEHTNEWLTGGSSRWVEVFRVDSADCLRLEAALLAKFRKLLLPQRTEMFKATAAQVLSVLESLVGPLAPRGGSGEYVTDWSRVSPDSKEARFALRLPGMEEWVEQNYEEIMRGWPNPTTAAARMYGEAFPSCGTALTPLGFGVALLRVGKRLAKARASAAKRASHAV